VTNDKIVIYTNDQKVYSRKNQVTEESLLSPPWEVVAVVGLDDPTDFVCDE